MPLAKDTVAAVVRTRKEIRLFRSGDAQKSVTPEDLLLIVLIYDNLSLTLDTQGEKETGLIMKIDNRQMDEARLVPVPIHPLIN